MCLDHANLISIIILSNNINRKGQFASLILKNLILNNKMNKLKMDKKTTLFQILCLEFKLTKLHVELYIQLFQLHKEKYLRLDVMIKALLVVKAFKKFLFRSSLIMLLI